MSARPPAPFAAKRQARHQRLAWLLVLLVVLAAVPIMKYLESRSTGTTQPTRPTQSSTPKTPATPVPPGPAIQPPASQPGAQPTTPATPTIPTAPSTAPSDPAQTPPAKPQRPKATAPKPAPTAKALPENASQAATPRAYRQDAAKHIYGRNTARIYKGKLQPLLYAIGVLQVNIDQNGKVRSLHWIRAPRHAPEVIREIERTVRAAARYPAPVRMGGVVYTDTWLWDKSGKFQLDTLTEGQL